MTRNRDGRDATLCQKTYEFDLGPFWLNLLAMIPVIDKLAYPLAVRRGIATIICPEPSEDLEKLTSKGWIIRNEEPTQRELFRTGSFATLRSSQDSDLLRRRNAVLAGGFRRTLFESLRIFGWTEWSRTLIARRYTHKFNGTYASYIQMRKEARAGLKLRNDH